MPRNLNLNLNSDSSLFWDWPRASCVLRTEGTFRGVLWHVCHCEIPIPPGFLLQTTLLEDDVASDEIPLKTTLEGILFIGLPNCFLSVEAYFLNQIWKKIASCKTDSGELSYMERDRETRRPVLIANLPPPTPWGFPEQGLKNMRLLTILFRTW